MRKIENTEPDVDVASLNDGVSGLRIDGGRVVQLDDGALTEILIRLPVKCVTRFKSVSKPWLSLISSHYFRHLYQLRKPPPSLILTSSVSYKITEFFYSNRITKTTSEEEQKPMIQPFDIEGINNAVILSCSNGLILLQKWNVNANVIEYYVYNPTTKQYSQKLAIDPSYTDWPYLAFDPSVSPHYKIVCHGKLHYIGVFDSGSGAWSKLWNPLGEITDFVQCKSFVYFINVVNPSTCFLHCFDIVKTGPLSTVCALPRRDAKSRLLSHTLQESDDRIYYSALFFSRLEVEVEAACLWELQVDKWVLKYDHTLQSNLLPRNVCEMKFIAETSTIIISIGGGKLMAYSFHDKSYKELLDLDTEIYSLHLHHFGHTLALTN